MLTLGEAIKRCEEVAENQRSKAHVYEDMMVHNQTIKHNSEAEYYEELMNECIECAKEHRQLVRLNCPHYVGVANGEVTE